MNTKQTIGLREFIALGVITVGMKLTDDTPVIYYKKLATSAWIAPLLSAVVVALFLYFTISALNKYDNHNLIDLIFVLFGKYLGWIFIFYLWLSLFIALVLDSGIYTDLISTMYFPNTPFVAIYFLLMGICCIGTLKGIGAISSTAWTVLIYIKAAFFVGLIITFFHGEIEFLWPILGNGNWEIIKESASAITIYDDFFYLCIFASMLPSKKDFKKGIWIMFTAVIVEITLAMISFLMVFDYKTAQLLNYPWHEVIRYISLGFLTNVETLFFPFWLLGLIIRFSTYLYLLVYMFGRLFKITQFKQLAPLFTILIIFLGLLPPQPSFTLPMLRRELLMYTVIPTCSLTVLIWIVAKFKTRRKKNAI